MIYTAFIIHGSYGKPNENWFPWLKEELEKINFNVITPTFPTPDGQNLFSWREVFYKHFINKVDSNTIFIGHSLGPAFILDIIENLDFSINSAFLVSPFIGLLNNPEFDLVNHTFTARHFDWDAIIKNCQKFSIYSSDNDPYVPFYKGQNLASNLDAKFETVENGGHINASAGFTTFPKLLADIKTQISY